MIVSALRVLPVVLFFLLEACSAPGLSPAVQNVSKAEVPSIEIERSGGDIWGKAPHYTLTLESTGRIVFTGIQNTKTGKAERYLSEKQIVELTNAIQTADFFSLENSYTSAKDNCPNWSTDQANIKITIVYEGKQKTIFHDRGCREQGVNGRPYPPELVRFEEQIEEIFEIRRLTGESEM
jgi:hypothetical protein